MKLKPINDYEGILPGGFKLEKGNGIDFVEYSKSLLDILEDPKSTPKIKEKLFLMLRANGYPINSLDDVKKAIIEISRLPNPKTMRSEKASPLFSRERVFNSYDSQEHIDENSFNNKVSIPRNAFDGPTGFLIKKKEKEKEQEQLKNSTDSLKDDLSNTNRSSIKADLLEDSENKEEKGNNQELVNFSKFTADQDKRSNMKKNLENPKKVFSTFNQSSSLNDSDIKKNEEDKNNLQSNLFLADLKKKDEREKKMKKRTKTKRNSSKSFFSTLNEFKKQQGLADDENDFEEKK